MITAKRASYDPPFFGMPAIDLLTSKCKCRALFAWAKSEDRCADHRVPRDKGRKLFFIPSLSSVWTHGKNQVSHIGVRVVHLHLGANRHIEPKLS